MCHIMSGYLGMISRLFLLCDVMSSYLKFLVPGDYLHYVMSCHIMSYHDIMSS